MNAYEQKQEARRERMLERAERLRTQAAADWRKADLREEVSGIPFGQPILVGHHSERKHRKAIERAHKALDRSVASSKRADDLERRASGTSSAISSDDPDAVTKLRAKIDKAEALQARMKAANKAVKKNDRAALLALGFTDEQATELFKPDFCGRVGFAEYALTNNSANIRRMKERLAMLERNADRETTERAVGSVRVVENAEANRLQLIFPGKPDDATRTALKSYGFRWSPSETAWQRQLNNGARWAAEQVLKAIA